MKHYHYIFTGTGAAALMTAYEMVLSGKFKNKSILLIDLDAKKTNDRTWCFWEEKNSPWDSIVTQKWSHALFKDVALETDITFDPYVYKMIQGIDFYNYIFTILTAETNITFIQQAVVNFVAHDDHVIVRTEQENFKADKVFNSIYQPKWTENNKKYPLIQQHFVGWYIKTNTTSFNPNKATFMDFSVPQNGNTRFMYVMPLTANEALVEYTLFSHQLLKLEEYESALKEYLLQLGITEYEITETEKGSIPMTAYPFWKHNSKHILHIGTAGGWTKASTGYTFMNSHRKSKSLIQYLEHHSDLSHFYKKNKFWYYDVLLLYILDQKNSLGSKIFSSLFQKGNSTLIFKFLDEKTTFMEDLKVISKCPKKPFIWALFYHIRNLLNL
ncbi:lycopene cyclase family protein [Flavobacterium sp. '19STA2R22 D10 B1']|uniref:lycopene cyclase family protein n=1 Tax=Flavobacterium aerium TaxID=3037261 RepID=UPI00278C646B|nr:lycopene cyclase family protein [Flavobacterium sp. '19STA2R22 D10 B1']